MKNTEDQGLLKSMEKLQVEDSASSGGTSSPFNFKRKPVIVIVVGMAGTSLTL